MIRIFNKELVAVENGAAKNVATVYCNSTDTKPTSDLANGSTLVEVDTGKNYLFNEATSSWVEVSGGGGSVNTNSKEVYTGTLDDLKGAGGGFARILSTHYGQTKPGTKWVDDMKSGNASAFIELDYTQLVGSTFNLTYIIGPKASLNNLCSQYMNATDTGITAFTYWSWTIASDGHATITGYGQLTGNEVLPLENYLQYIPYTLTLYWHEMPTA